MNSISIKAGLPKRCFIIAEAGVNHNGNPDLALQLVDEAATTGADAVKFQTFSAAKLVRAGTPTATYQQTNAGETDQYTMLRRLELPPELLQRLADRCVERGIEFMSTPFDADAIDALMAVGMKRIKIPSGELTNLPFLARVARTGLPMILSTGMATMDEVEEAIGMIGQTLAGTGVATRLAERLTVLHCTTSYPTAPSDVNLRSMLTLREKFSLPVGYSDHTDGTAVSVAAVALGAEVVEKHFTLDQTLPGPDHRASLPPGEFTQMVRQIRVVEQCLGDGVKAPRHVELPTRELVRRSVVAARDLAAGQALEPDDVVLLRPGTGIAPRELPRVLGRRMARAVVAGELLAWEDLRP